MSAARDKLLPEFLGDKKKDGLSVGAYLLGNDKKVEC